MVMATGPHAMTQLKDVYGNILKRMSTMPMATELLIQADLVIPFNKPIDMISGAIPSTSIMVPIIIA